MKLKVNPEGLAWLKKTEADDFQDKPGMKTWIKNPEPGEFQDKPGMKTWIKKPGTRWILYFSDKKLCLQYKA